MVRYIETVTNQSIEEDPFRFIQTHDVLYMSEWFEDKGFALLAELEKYRFIEKSRCREFVDRYQRLFDRTFQDGSTEDQFIAIISYAVQAYHFALTYGKEKESYIAHEQKNGK